MQSTTATIDAIENYNQHVPRPPVLRDTPLIGSLPALLRDPIDLALRGYRKYGPVYRVNVMGVKVVIFAGPEAMQFIARHERQYFSASGQLDAAARIFGVTPESMMVNLDGDLHRAVRGDQKNPMSRSFMEKQLDAVMACVDDYIEGLPKHRAQSITEVAKRLVYNQLGLAMSGEYKPELFPDAKNIMDTLVNTVTKPWTSYLPIHRTARRSLEAFRRYAEDLKQRAGDVDPDRKDLNLTETVFAGVKRGLYQEKDVPLLLTGPYIAGLDTAAHALAFALYGIASRPEVLAELREEIDAAMVKGPLTPQVLKQMGRVRGAVMESMRMYSITSFQSRRAATDFIANGFQVRKNERVLFAPTIGHRMAEHFPDPENFDIHRYDKDRGEHKTPGVFQPYGAGVHVCLGAGVADALIALDLVKILHRYEVVLEPKRYRLKVKSVPTPAPVGLKVRFVPR